MKNRFLKWIFLPVWLVLCLVVISAVSLILVFIKGSEQTIAAYVIYAFSFYALVTLCLACWKTIPNHYKNAKSKIYGNKYANKYFTDTEFRTHINLYRSLAFNLLYIGINVVSAAVYHTAWFGIFAGYYAIMAVMRFLLVRYMGRHVMGLHRRGELKRARLCAYILLTVNLSLSAAVLMMIGFDRRFEYQGVLIYVMALYTFYITTMAVIDLIKYRKYNNPIISVAKVIRLASALVSMLFLETAMLSQFGGDSSPLFQKIMISSTGAGISVIVVSLSVYMIVKYTKEIKNIQINKS